MTRAGKKESVRISPKAYGARRDLTRQAVMRAIAAGRLRESVHKTDAGHWRIDPELADREWKAWTDPAKVPKTKAGGRPTNTGSLFGEDDRRDAISHARASADRIRVDMALKQLELDERRGLLIDRAAVSRAAFQAARELREFLGGIPDRLAAELHAAHSIHDVHRLLTGEIVRVLDTFAASRELRELTEPAPGPEA